MQIGRLHVASRHVVRQSFLCTQIFASKMKLKQKGLNWDLNLGPSVRHQHARVYGRVPLGVKVLLSISIINQILFVYMQQS